MSTSIRHCPSTRAHRANGFTFIDLMVFLCAFAILLTLIVPTVVKTRASANTLRCAANMRSVTAGMLLYAQVYDGAIPGSPWTSGAHVRDGTELAEDRLPHLKAFCTDDDTPGVCGPFDWASPIAKVMGIPFNDGPTREDRKSRFVEFLRPAGIFACPSNALQADGYDAADWGPLPRMSYTTCIDFMLKHNATGDTANSRVGRWITRPEWNVPVDYLPKLDKVGNPANKVFLSEGTRFTKNGTDWTYNGNVFASQYGGAYADQRIYLAGTYQRARPLPKGYGDLKASPSATGPSLVPIGYRHGATAGGAPRDAYRMNLAFFDGHVETVSLTAAMNPNWHSPVGTILWLNAEQAYPIAYQRYNGGAETKNFVVAP